MVEILADFFWMKDLAIDMAAFLFQVKQIPQGFEHQFLIPNSSFLI